MVKEVTMPKLAMTQETGTILKWYKSEGDPVETGEPILEVMTNKVNIDVESYNDGILLKRLYEEGAEVPVLEVIAYVGNAGEQVPEIQNGSSEHGAPTQNQSFPPEPYSMNIRATPAARALARVEGVNLQQVSGSGNRGRIHRVDVQAFLEERNATLCGSPSERRKETSVFSPSPVPAPTKEVEPKPKPASGDVVKRLSSMRRMIGERMAESAFQAPHVTLMLEADMFHTTELRKKLLPLIEEQTGNRLSINTIILKAVASVLRKHPNVNATWQSENELVQHTSVNLGMAVAVSDGLVVPVISEADRMGLSELSIATKRIAEEARTQKLTPKSFENGTFTVSNLGMYGIETFTPIINPPQVAILGVGSVVEKPVAINGKVEIRPRMALSLSFDHRALDGAEAARFLKDLEQVLEEPMLVLV